MNENFKNLILSISSFGFIIYESIKEEKETAYIVFAGVILLISIFDFIYKRHKKKTNKKDVYREILNDLEEDYKKLLLIIPLLKIKNNSVPIKHKFNTNSTYLKHLHTLRDEKNPHIEINNKAEINLISDWINWASAIHRHFNMTSSVDFINDNKDKILISLKNIKDFYTAKT